MRTDQSCALYVHIIGLHAYVMSVVCFVSMYYVLYVHIICFACMYYVQIVYLHAYDMSVV